MLPVKFFEENFNTFIGGYEQFTSWDFNQEMLNPETDLKALETSP